MEVRQQKIKKEATALYWYLKVFKAYNEIDGRASRAEFWNFFLVHLLINLGTIIIDSALGFGLDSIGFVNLIYNLAVLLPSIGVSIRRLHDADLAGRWFFLILVPVFGLIILIVLWAVEGTEGPNQYGSEPTE